MRLKEWLTHIPIENQTRVLDFIWQRYEEYKEVEDGCFVNPIYRSWCHSDHYKITFYNPETGEMFCKKVPCENLERALEEYTRLANGLGFTTVYTDVIPHYNYEVLHNELIGVIANAIGAMEFVKWKEKWGFDRGQVY